MFGFGLILQHIIIQIIPKLKWQYITKDVNPPNAPMICPIEMYWSILKQKVYENNWSAENCDQLIRKIKSCAKKIQASYLQKPILYSQH